MKKFWRVAATATMALTLLTACGPAEKETTEQGESYVTVTDAIGKEITLVEVPDRIVSLTPSNTEILFGLGLADAVVGVNDADNYPVETAEKEKVGGTEYNLEAIIALQPDLVLAHESSMSTLELAIPQLEAVGIPVFVVDNAESFEETYVTMEQIGELTGKDAEADVMIAQIQADVAKVQETVAGQPAKSAFLVVGATPDIYVAGQGTFMNEMLAAIRVENAVKEEGWPMYSAEEFVAANPDSLIFTYVGDDETIKTNPVFAVMKAIQTDALTVVDGDTTSRQGPRLADGVEELARAIYPEAFNE